MTDALKNLDAARRLIGKGDSFLDSALVIGLISEGSLGEGARDQVAHARDCLEEAVNLCDTLLEEPRER